MSTATALPVTLKPGDTVVTADGRYTVADVRDVNAIAKPYKPQIGRMLLIQCPTCGGKLRGTEKAFKQIKPICGTCECLMELHTTAVATPETV